MFTCTLKLRLYCDQGDISIYFKHRATASSQCFTLIAVRRNTGEYCVHVNVVTVSLQPLMTSSTRFINLLLCEPAHSCAIFDVYFKD